MEQVERQKICRILLEEVFYRPSFSDLISTIIGNEMQGKTIAQIRQYFIYNEEYNNTLAAFENHYINTLAAEFNFDPIEFDGHTERDELEETIEIISVITSLLPFLAYFSSLSYREQREVKRNDYTVGNFFSFQTVEILLEILYRLLTEIPPSTIYNSFNTVNFGDVDATDTGVNFDSFTIFYTIYFDLTKIVGKEIIQLPFKVR